MAEPFRVHILGCGSALPSVRHNPSSQIVEIRGKYFMIDCGEGTQLQIRRSKINFNKIYAVFISHLHGDHVLGLIGMISTFGLNGRNAPLHVYAPAEYEHLLAQEQELFCRDLDFEVVFHSVDTTKNSVIYDDRSLTVETIPLNHRVPCCGFLFKEKSGMRHIRRDMIDYYKVPISQINNIRSGRDWIDGDGNLISNSELTLPADPARSYAYCSDTRFIPTLYKYIKDVNLLYHESTYTEDNVENAKKYYHSTASEAAKVAKMAGAHELLLGHYSKRYNNEAPFLEEAKRIFASTKLTNELMVFDVV